eukprot:12285443-Alexandrium_andersonii.AAC.1
MAALTFVYLSGVGAEVAVEKTGVLGTSGGLRGALERHTFSSIGARLTVERGIRDVGSHLTFGRRTVGCVGTSRLRLAILVARRIRTTRARATK